MYPLGVLQAEREGNIQRIEMLKIIYVCLEFISTAFSWIMSYYL